MSPDLNIGITSANLREIGKTPSEIDLLIKCVNDVTYESTFIFKMVGGISSHSGELFFKPLMTFYFILCNMRDKNRILREGYII